MPASGLRSTRISILLGLLCVFATGRALAAPCPRESRLRSGGTVNLRVDNDLFGGLGQDQGYSNGFLVTWVSPNLVDFVGDPCLPGIVRGLNRYLAWLQPEGFDEQNMTIGLAQLMYTPGDKTANYLIEDD